MISKADNLIGIGLYTAEEAALYARVNKRTMNRWVFGDAAGDSVIDAELGRTEEKIVTFLDFVQTMAIRQVRLREKQFPLQKIRKACELAKKKYGLRYPLAARDHRIYLFGPENLKLCEMLISMGKDEFGRAEYLQISGKKTGNRILTEIAEPFMKGLQFGQSPFAESFRAWEQNDLTIVMDPHQRFGEPFLPSCGYTALALWEAHISEGSVELAAKAYGVTEEEVMLACSYYDHLKGSDAT
jgi:uncharacterized protein (DUF433 family)